MKKESPEKIAGSSGLMGTLKILGVSAVLMIASLTMLLILDIIPRYLFNDLVVKSGTVIGVWAIAAGLVALLLRLK